MEALRAPVPSAAGPPPYSGHCCTRTCRCRAQDTKGPPHLCRKRRPSDPLPLRLRWQAARRSEKPDLAGRAGSAGKEAVCVVLALCHLCPLRQDILRGGRRIVRLFLFCLLAVVLCILYIPAAIVRFLFILLGDLGLAGVRNLCILRII